MFGLYKSIDISGKTAIQKDKGKIIVTEIHVASICQFPVIFSTLINPKLNRKLISMVGTIKAKPLRPQGDAFRMPTPPKMKCSPEGFFCHSLIPV